MTKTTNPTKTAIPIKTASDVVDAINEGYRASQKEKPRRYIGASSIGNTCDANLTLSMRGFPNDPPEPGLARIFKLGHALEDMVVADLKKMAGISMWEVDGVTGKQFAYAEWGGHVVCHMDGHIEFADEEVRVLEIKSMNLASFEKFMKVGIKRSHPSYYAQMQMMLGMSGMRQALMLAICKNNSRYHAEIVDFDELEYAFICERIKNVLAGSAKKRVSPDPLDWRCKGCFKRSACWEPELQEVVPSCPTCAFSRPKPNGDWECTKFKIDAHEACGSYQRFIVDPKE